MKRLQQDIDWAKGDGLVPAIVQHAVTGRVLMLGYMNADALAATQESDWVTFFSRSRQCLWTKGETSGNRLKLHSLEIDCDNDSLLVTATPSGPTCHLGKYSCFDQEEEQQGFGFIGQLESIIGERQSDQPTGSYTARLMREGTKKIAQKVGEEGVEVALAAMSENREEIIDEVADLMFHVLVLLKHQGLSMSDVAHRLAERHQ